MADVKKATVKKPVAKKVEAPKAEAAKVEAVKVEAVKVEAPKTEAPKAEKKVEAPKAEKKVEAPKAEKKVEKKAATVKEPAAKKVEVKNTVHVQFAGKSYSQDDLVKMAKDVWKYDLKQKASDFKSVELYVKPEESIVYYVINKEFTGSFYI
ncbi:MAG: DUF6465 family protein [Acetatifactor sp.]